MQTAAQKSHPLSHTDAVTDKSQGSGMVLQFHSPCSLASDATFFSPVCASSYILLLLKTWGIRNRKQGRMRKVCNSPKDRQHDKGQQLIVSSAITEAALSLVSSLYVFGVHQISLISRASQLSCIT